MLRGASATFGRGQLVVLMGRSGSGKSTLLNLIAGIDLPSQGSVTIDGVPLSRLGDASARSSAATTSASCSSPSTCCHLTVAENLLLPLELKGSVGATPRPPPWPSSTRCGWPTARRASPTASPAASSSASRWRGR